ncbi:four helix bundle protein [Solitalea canadensis]|uniref:TIGR02436 family protein n=1 Tax=Solitalea canadensis (strain ATCC 29591 / DSM 3403 / JCM 21819 / LMG 8368 / NBRC 15130 / NCIMB 12057 / USAM 9D) TaxID=929556 RepID=H8KU47_SOLCM|nr:four helix bundle protein [Solitalea canadensis]AFD07027.1 TIGR02436 family protein [Solitalea canadensis DSM 3403]
MEENIVKNKSFGFAVRIVKLYQYLCEQKKECTSVGAMVREAEHAESKTDFKHKMAIAQKEINETKYWLELLQATDYLTREQFESINNDAVEIIKLLTVIIKSAKNQH